MDYITIATTGNAIDFGDTLSGNTDSGPGGTSNSTIGIFGGGAPTSNVIQQITIASTGNATDFGDLATATNFVGATSDGHGGLQ